MKLLIIQRDVFANIGLMYLSSYVKKEGHKCELLIDSVTRDIVQKIKRIDPDVIGITCTTGIHIWALKLAKKIKENFDKPVILGGPHPTFFPEIIGSPYVDMVCRGEGEASLAQMLNQISQKKDITNIPGFWIKKGGIVFKNDVPSLIQNLDKIPWPDRSLYKHYSFIMSQSNLSFITGRGCPYSCTFCFNHALKKLYHNSGNYLRRRSVRDVISELEHCKKEYKIKSINFQDDTFIISSGNWLNDFADEYSTKIKLPFSCCVRANLINEEVVKIIKKAGCHSVMLGVECADETLNCKILKKGLSKEQIVNAIRILQKYGIKIETFNLIGIPGETIEQAISTMEFNAMLKVNYARAALVQPYPGTELEQYAKKQGYLDPKFNIDTFESSYFMGTPIKLKNKNQFVNLQRFFSLGARFPFLIPLIKRLIKIRPNFAFDTIFKLDYGLSVTFLNNFSIKDLFNLGRRANTFFKKS